MSKDWTDKLPSLLEEYEESAPQGLWDAVLDGMAGRKKRVAAFWRAGGILSAAAAAVLAVFLWKPTAEPAIVSPVPETMMAESLPENTLADEPAPEAEPEAAASTPSGHKPAPQPQEQTGAEALTDSTSSQAWPRQEYPAHQDKATEPVPEKPAKEEVTVPAGFKRPTRKIQVRLSSGTYLAQASNELFQGYGVPYNPGVASATKSGEEGGITVPMLSRNRESATEASHRQLFRVQFAISYPLSARWSIGSGISYSLLQSDYSTVSGETHTNTTRQVHYLGVPLTVQFKAFEFKRLSLIAEAGPMFEAAVGSHVKTLSYVGEMLASRQLEYLGAKDFQWSVNAGIGVQYQLFRYGALFVQPGISWHFAGSGKLESVYTQHPLSFDLSFGYRFTF